MLFVVSITHIFVCEAISEGTRYYISHSCQLLFVVLSKMTRRELNIYSQLLGAPHYYFSRLTCFPS